MNIVITGASRGIGKAIALEFGKSGNNTFFLCCKSDISELFGLSDNLELLNNNVIIRQLDVTDRPSIRREINMLNIIHPEFKVDILINNAGILRDRTLMKMTDEEWDSVIGTNLTGVFNMTKAFLPLFDNAGGNIVSIGSIVGSIGNFGQTNYSASKSALIAFTKSLAQELASKRINVNLVSPSLVDTPMIQRLTSMQITRLIERTAIKRIAKPEEIARFIVFLCTNGTYCTGQNYLIDGGFT